MTLAVATTMVCDVCGEQTEDRLYGVGITTARPRQHRRDWRENDGWRRILADGRMIDLCAVCYVEWRAAEDREGGAS